MNTGSLRLGRWFGIEVRLHWSVVIVAALLGADMVVAIGALPAVAGVSAFFVSILVHEFGHALTARHFGVGTTSIQLWALGGVARFDREAPTARAEGWIAAAGPMSSVAVAVVALGTWWTAGGRSGDDLVFVAGWIGIMNAALALFNLLPGAPLDGGRIVKAARWGRHGDRRRAEREAGRAGVVIGVSVAAIGGALLFSTGGGIWLVVTGLFIAVNARLEIAAAVLAERLGDVRVRDLTWFGLAEATGTTDTEAMLGQRRRLGGAGGLAVIDLDGRPIGIVLEDDLLDVPAEHRRTCAIDGLMTSFDRTVRANPDDVLVEVLPGLDPKRPVITVWDDDRLVGLVPPRRLRERLGAA